MKIKGRHIFKFLLSFFPDIDECSAGMDRCHRNSICINIQGSYHCQCRNGFYSEDYPDNQYGALCTGKYFFRFQRNKVLLQVFKKNVFYRHNYFQFQSYQAKLLTIIKCSVVE